MKNSKLGSRSVHVAIAITGILKFWSWILYPPFQVPISGHCTFHSDCKVMNCFITIIIIIFYLSNVPVRKHHHDIYHLSHFCMQSKIFLWCLLYYLVVFVMFCYFTQEIKNILVMLSVLFGGVCNVLLFYSRMFLLTFMHIVFKNDHFNYR